MASRYPLVTPAEAAIAGALVKAQIAYRYEPKSFRFVAAQIRRAEVSLAEFIAGGNSWRAFCPDFYLTDHRIYLEVGNVRHKRAKLRTMRACYPNVRVIVVDNSRAEWLAGLPSEELFSQLMEIWVEQEFLEPASIAVRTRARAAARSGTATPRPSMRSC